MYTPVQGLVGVLAMLLHREVLTARRGHHAGCGHTPRRRRQPTAGSKDGANNAPRFVPGLQPASAREPAAGGDRSHRSHSQTFPSSASLVPGCRRAYAGPPVSLVLEGETAGAHSDDPDHAYEFLAPVASYDDIRSGGVAPCQLRVWLVSETLLLLGSMSAFVHLGDALACTGTYQLLVGSTALLAGCEVDPRLDVLAEHAGMLRDTVEEDMGFAAVDEAGDVVMT